MGANLRAALRLLAVVPVGAALLLLPAAARLVALGRPAAGARAGTLALHVFSRVVLPLLGVRVRDSGPRPLGACVVTPNHLSWLDVFVLASRYRTAFVSRADVARWPVTGLAARLVGTLFIEREIRRDASRVADEVGAALDAGVAVTVFLEGRAGRGEELRPFRSPLLEPAARSGARTVPAALVYSAPDGVDVGRVVAWADAQPFPGHVWGILRLRRVEAQVRFGAPRSDTDRKRLARALEGDVRGLLGAATARSPDARSGSR